MSDEITLLRELCDNIHNEVDSLGHAINGVGGETWKMVEARLERIKRLTADANLESLSFLDSGRPAGLSVLAWKLAGVVLSVINQEGITVVTDRAAMMLKNDAAGGERELCGKNRTCIARELDVMMSRVVGAALGGSLTAPLVSASHTTAVLCDFAGEPLRMERLKADRPLTEEDVVAHYNHVAGFAIDWEKNRVKILNQTGVPVVNFCQEDVS